MLSVTDPGVLAEHVRQERARLGLTLRSATELARAAHVKIKFQTWHKFERDGKVTPTIRSAVAAAFDWPKDWPENPPALTEWNQHTLLETVTLRVAALEQGQEEIRDLVRQILSELHEDGQGRISRG